MLLNKAKKWDNQLNLKNNVVIKKYAISYEALFLHARVSCIHTVTHSLST